MRARRAIGAWLAAGLLAAGGCVTGDWERARAEDSAAAYHRYLRDHPDSRYAPEARERLDYLRLKHDPSVEGLRAFRRAHPTSVHLAELAALLEEPAFAAARAAGTAEAYEAFAKRHPSGRLTARALGNAAYLRARGFAGRVDALADFIERHPASDYADEARRSLDTLAARSRSGIAEVELAVEVDPSTPGAQQLARAFAERAVRIYESANRRLLSAAPRSAAAPMGDAARARLTIRHREGVVDAELEEGRVAGGLLAVTEVTLERPGAAAPVWSRRFAFRGEAVDRRPDRSLLFSTRAQRYWASFFVPIATWSTDAARRSPRALPQPGVAVDMVGDRAVVLFGDGSFELLDLADPEQIEVLARYQRPRDLTQWGGVRVTGSHVLLYGEDGIEIVALADGGYERVAAFGRDQVGSVEGAAAVGGDFVIGGTRGLFLVTGTLEAAQLVLSAPVRAVATVGGAVVFVDDTALYVATPEQLIEGRSAGGVRLGRVFGPVRLESAGTELDLLVNGGYLRLDLRDPAEPRVRARIESSQAGEIRDVARVDARIFLIGERGLLVLDASGSRIVDSVDVAARARLDGAGRHLVAVDGEIVQVIDATGFIAPPRLAAPAAAAPAPAPPAAVRAPGDA